MAVPHVDAGTAIFFLHNRVPAPSHRAGTRLSALARAMPMLCLNFVF